MNKWSLMKLSMVVITCSVVVSAVLLGVSALLMEREVIPLEAADVTAIISMFVPVMSACALVVKRVDKNKLLAAVAVSAVYTLLNLLIVCILTPVENYKLGWKVLIPALAALAAGILNSARRTRRR